MLHERFVQKMFALLLTFYERAKRRGSSGDSLIIKNFYLQYRIEEEQRTEFYQICQERYQGQTQVNFSCGVRYTVEPIGFL